MIRIKSNSGVSGTVPSSFDELSYEQLITYLEVIELRRDELFKTEGKKILIKNPDLFFEAQVLLLKCILPVSEKEFDQIPAGYIRDLMVEEELISFFFFDLLYKNPLPFVSPGMVRYYGPGDGFHKLTFQEFGMADEIYMRWSQSNSEDDLNELVAILYRRASRKEQENGDKRETFNHVYVDERKLRFQKLPYLQKRLIALWYNHNRLLLLHKYQAVFDKKGKKDPDASESSWIKTAMSLGDGVVNFKQISQTNVYLVFEEMQRLVELKEDMEAKNGSD